MIAVIAAVSAGGIAGTLMRFAAANWVNAHWPRHFYLGTLAVNLIGCLLIGLLYGLFLHGPLG
ncbi:MAG: CrcB family protein, partial [Pseudomonas sp.]